MFKSDPGLVPVPPTIDLWWLDGPLIYTGSMGTMVIPFGFISDDASTPKCLDWIPFLDRQGLSRRPGLLHDGIYSLGREKGKDFADAVLRESLMSEGMTRMQAEIYYRAVQLFGGYAWNHDAYNGLYGVSQGDFISEAAYQQWRASGATIYAT